MMTETADTPIAKLLERAGRRAPRALSASFAQASRDASVLENRLLYGRAPAPLVDRGPRHEPAPVAPSPSVPATAVTPTPVAAPTAAVTVTVLDGALRTTCVPSADQHVLAAALEAGANMPFSCALGGCGSCKVRLVSGAYEMDDPNCLTDEERAAGFVLTCVGRALSACTLEIVR